MFVQTLIASHFLIRSVFFVSKGIFLRLFYSVIGISIEITAEVRFQSDLQGKVERVIDTTINKIVTKSMNILRKSHKVRVT